MNIAPFSPISIFKIDKIRKNNAASAPNFKGLSRDIFVRQNKTANVGTLNPRYRRYFDAFQKEAEEYILNTPTITYEGLQDIICGYSDDDVKPYKEEDRVNKKTSALYQYSICLEKIGNKIIQTDSTGTIYVNIPEVLDRENRVKFLASFVHEAVHMFQEKDAVKHGEGNFIIEYYRSAPKGKIEQIPKAIDDLSHGFSKTEQNLCILMEHFLSSCSRLEDCSLDNFNRYLKQKHKMNLGETIELLVQDAFYESGEDIIKAVGKKGMKHFIKNKAANELEAYAKEDEIVKKYSKEDFNIASSALTVEVYKCLLKLFS